MIEFLRYNLRIPLPQLKGTDTFELRDDIEVEGFDAKVFDKTVEVVIPNEMITSYANNKVADEVETPEFLLPS